MNKQAISNALKALQKTVKKHSPEILTGIGIAGMTAAAVMAVKATPKALRMVDEKEIRDGKRLTTGEIVKTTWKCYIPPVVTGVCSAACIIGASSISARRNAALVTAYTMVSPIESSQGSRPISIRNSLTVIFTSSRIRLFSVFSAHLRGHPDRVVLSGL